MGECTKLHFMHACYVQVFYTTLTLYYDTKRTPPVWISYTGLWHGKIHKVPNNYLSYNSLVHHTTRLNLFILLPT